MKFYKINSAEPVAKIVAEKLIAHLSAGEKVFWLVTGGTAIGIEVAVGRLLNGSDASKLTVALLDERYGPVGHTDSNWQQLLDAGFEIPGAVMVPILRGEDRAKTTKQFEEILADNFALSDYSLGQFGIGPDGHTAGILPGSPRVDTDELAASYADSEVTVQSPPGVKRGPARITITAAAIAKLDEAVVCALGETKRPALDMLEQDVPVEGQPSQALKRVAHFSVYNDYKGVSI